MNTRVLLLLCAFNAFLLRSEAKDTLDVVIIGAGVSGLSAGRYLLQSKKQKYNVTILEARNRTGGRVWTNLKAFQGAVGGEVDCGASWIHGGDAGNPIRDFAEKNHIETKEIDYDDILMKRNGKTIPGSELDAKEKAYNKMIKQLDQSDFGNISIRAALENLGYRDTLENPIISWFIMVKEADDGASIDKIINGDDYKLFAGEDRIFPKGYSQVTESLLHGGEGESALNVLYNQPVKRVVVINDSVTVYTESTKYRADRVIVTLPLGVLKNGDVAFDPPLSAPKQEAIHKIGFGLLSKVFLKFDSVFWDKETQFFGIVPEDINQRGFLTFWVNGYYISGTPSLIGFISGDSAISAEAMSDDALRKEAMKIVRMLLGSAPSQLSDFYRTTWLSDPYSRGSYSYSAVGSNSTHRAALGQPESPLHFAGEHTQYNFFSTVHGAYFSGIRAAKEIDKSVLPPDQMIGHSRAETLTQLPLSLLPIILSHILSWLLK